MNDRNDTAKVSNLIHQNGVFTAKDKKTVYRMEVEAIIKLNYKLNHKTVWNVLSVYLHYGIISGDDIIKEQRYDQLSTVEKNRTNNLIKQ